MRIAILGAMSEEIEFLLKAVGDYQKIDYARNSFYKAQCGNHELVIAYSKIGKVNANKYQKRNAHPLQIPFFWFGD